MIAPLLLTMLAATTGQPAAATGPDGGAAAPLPQATASNPPAPEPTEKPLPEPTPIKAPPAKGPIVDGAGPLLTVTVDGGITRVVRDFLVEAIEEAEAKKAQALIVRLDTPGGLLDATRDIVSAFLNAEVPIIVWVGPSGARAGSAGVFITMAGHVAAMAPGTNIGAAHPVSAMGEDIEGQMDKKVTNDTAAWARSIAQLRGRNADWAAEAVRESASIPEQEALKLRVVDLVVRSEDELLRAIDGRVIQLPESRLRLHTEGLAPTAIKMTARQGLVQFLANPNLAYILLLVGMFGLFLEFKAPGLMVPGVVGAICIALVLGVQVMPVNWLGVLLIAAAAVALVAEVFVPSFGLLTATGVTCLVLGSYLLFDVPGSDFRVEPAIIWSAAGGFVIVVLTIGAALLRSLREPPASGASTMVGEVGLWVQPGADDEAGRVQLRGTTWPAHSAVALAEGSPVRVLAVEGITLTVAPETESKEV